MKTIKVKTPKRYEIQIGKGLVKHSLLPKGTIITDKNVSQHYDILMKKNKTLIISPGEKSKSAENYIKILDKLGNIDTLIAFGGGVIGDLTGFIASTYKRGVSLVQIPTSLLAMVDSSIGGKNGVNLGIKKNYVGTIYQPDIVLIDPLFLETLPDIEFQNGVAEIIKYSVLFNQPSLERLEIPLNANDEDIEEIIFQCCKIKAKIVEKDEYDKGYRHTLNLGHTIGHAIEILYGLSHGHAIAIGMVKELELGKKLGIINNEKIERVKIALEANHLPTRLPKDYNIEEIINLIRLDKKGAFVFAFDKKNYNIKVDEQTVREVLVA